MTDQHCGWEDLSTELAHWRRSGRRATLWMRDDDATAANPALHRLAALSSRWRVPLSLAVIPARASATLREILDICPEVAVLQHGYAHIDYGGGVQPAAELGEHRAAEVVLDELKRGHEQLIEMLGDCFVPVLVPPWNRISPRLVPRLVDLNYCGLSCFSARERVTRGSRLVLANCHVDPVHWKKGGVFRGEGKSLAMLIGHLRARRFGQVDAQEPTGILTHHWSHDEATWAFVERLLEQTHDCSEVHWLGARQVFRS